MIGWLDQPLAHVGQARRHDDPGGQMIALLRKHGELRKLRQGHVHAEGRAFAAPAVHSGGDIGLDSTVGDQPVEQQLRIDARYDDRRAHRLVARHDARGAVALDDDLLHRRVEDDVDTFFPAGASHGLSDRPHAADGMTPGALDPCSLTK